MRRRMATTALLLLTLVVGIGASASEITMILFADVSKPPIGFPPDMIFSEEAMDYVTYDADALKAMLSRGNVCGVVVHRMAAERMDWDWLGEKFHEGVVVSGIAIDPSELVALLTGELEPSDLDMKFFDTVYSVAMLRAGGSTVSLGVYYLDQWSDRVEDLCLDPWRIR